ncbi:hypothetical protein CBLAS_0825 [Campylobacter blaseri]|uniref:Uncharacterized protein n=1 Tax=Campylobacter blaseri TaxID=2042961 RepID=A0A2P8R2I7_9BACT|nr:hypothetical protein [Campylobacter blaseri]PSM52710.1 hypothetical protein CQ405_02980 [Campylobacter blaseri]PSM54358.1 hypothetical protein CRN67_02980 [Campylobacter blaseri]QKF86012.1 hypothetical protein CBLAS_0825 [Campylobacter blaseri]
MKIALILFFIAFIIKLIEPKKKPRYRAKRKKENTNFKKYDDVRYKQVYDGIKRRYDERLKEYLKNQSEVSSKIKQKNNMTGKKLKAINM